MIKRKKPKTEIGKAVKILAELCQKHSENDGCYECPCYWPQLEGCMLCREPGDWDWQLIDVAAESETQNE